MNVNLRFGLGKYIEKGRNTKFVTQEKESVNVGEEKEKQSLIN